MSQTVIKDLVRKPHRVRHSYTQSINAAPDEVFPLLCPVRELDWAPGWQPDWVISDSGVAETGCVFQTPGDSTQDQAATWVITRHDPESHEVEMLKIIPGYTLMRLQASLEAEATGGTSARIAYEYTALGSGGDAFVEQCTEAWYMDFMHHWESAMNDYLGSKAA